MRRRCIWTSALSTFDGTFLLLLTLLLKVDRADVRMCRRRHGGVGSARGYLKSPKQAERARVGFGLINARVPGDQHLSACISSGITTVIWVTVGATKGTVTDSMSHSQFHCHACVYLDTHGLVFQLTTFVRFGWNFRQEAYKSKGGKKVFSLQDFDNFNLTSFWDDQEQFTLLVFFMTVRIETADNCPNSFIFV